MDLGVDLQGKEEQGTFTFPSPPVGVMPEVVHYNAHSGQIDSKNDVGLTQETSQACNVEDKSLLSQVSEIPSSQQKKTLT